MVHDWPIDIACTTSWKCDHVIVIPRFMLILQTVHRKVRQYCSTYTDFGERMSFFCIPNNKMMRMMPERNAIDRRCQSAESYSNPGDDNKSQDRIGLLPTNGPQFSSDMTRYVNTTLSADHLEQLEVIRSRTMPTTDDNIAVTNGTY